MFFYLPRTSHYGLIKHTLLSYKFQYLPMNFNIFLVCHSNVPCNAFVYQYLLSSCDSCLIILAGEDGLGSLALRANSKTQLSHWNSIAPCHTGTFMPWIQPLNKSIQVRTTTWKPPKHLADGKVDPLHLINGEDFYGHLLSNLSCKTLFTEKVVSKHHPVVLHPRLRC